MASTVRPVLPRLEPAASLRQPAALTDDLLQEIFLRIDSPADLARASTACVSFSRLIAELSFLRRYHSTHPPLLLGFLYDGFCRAEIFKPVEAPHPNAPAARAVASDLNFSFYDYLPLARWLPWYLRDVRDGRALFVSISGNDEDVLPDLAVCDPLSRGSLLLPPIPDDLVKGQILHSADEDDETSFRVMGEVHCESELVVLAFKSTSSSWSIVASINWNALSLSGRPILQVPCYACGCFYWKFHWMNKDLNPDMNTNKLLKLDMTKMEFSTVDLPLYHDEWLVLVVEAGEDRIGIFCHKQNDTSEVLLQYAKC